MKTYKLPSEQDATNLVVTMSQIVSQYGYVTVKDVNDLLGFTNTAVDARNGWRTTSHVLHPSDGSSVMVDFPNPVALFNNEIFIGTIRLTMDFDATELMERRITDFLNTTELLKDATGWSITKRPHYRLRGGPRVAYNSPYERDDL